MDNKEIGDKTRSHLANERTFLSWIRTSLGVIAFGFVVERFSLFMNQLALFVTEPKVHGSVGSIKGVSSFLGATFMAVGALIALIAFLQYKSLSAQIDLGIYSPSIKIELFLTLLVIGMGLFLGVFLFFNF